LPADRQRAMVSGGTLDMTTPWKLTGETGSRATVLQIRRDSYLQDRGDTAKLCFAYLEVASFSSGIWQWRGGLGETGH
jgi:hypothetical protein